MAVNKVILVGRVTRNAEIRMVGSSTVANFDVAAERNYKAKGEEKPKTDFIPVEVWGQGADFAGRNFRKGSLVHVIGSMQNSVYQQDGHTVRTFKVRAEDIGVEVFAKPEEPKNNAKPMTDRPLSEAELLDDTLPF